MHLPSPIPTRAAVAAAWVVALAWGGALPVAGDNALECPEDLSFPATPLQPGAIIAYTTPPPAVEGGGPVFCTPASGSFFPIGTTEVTCYDDSSSSETTPCSFTITVQESDNIVWPRARNIPLSDTTGTGVLQGATRTVLTAFDQSRWYKFRVRPDSRVVVTLTQLPANYDLVLFKDISTTYRQITTPSDLPLLDAEFADEAFSPAQFSPAQFSPAQFSPAQFSPAQFSPAQFSPDAYSPAQFSPAQFSPAQFSPAQFSPAQFSPAQFSPAQFSEEAYAAAQSSSVIGVSAYDGLAGEGLTAYTWNESGDFYIRIRGRQGAFNPTHPVRLDVYLLPGECGAINSIPLDPQGNPLPPSNFQALAANSETLILTDFDRLVGPGPSPARLALEAKLGQLANRPEVAGQVLDVGNDPWVRAFNEQADANLRCPYAKNLVAEAIRAIVQRSRSGNNLKYLVLVGGDDVLPFFRHNDEAMLGPEQDYFPPVLDATASQASLRRNYFLTQDRYGSQCDISRKNSRLPIPNLATGRLVETIDEIETVIDAYLENPGGVLPAPSGVFVSGYDFLVDAAVAVADELQAGTGVVVERLITPAHLAPADPGSWTADQLRAGLFGSRHDILYLAGHFSAAGALAADYSTRILAEELLTAPVDFRHVLLYSAGCHSGYNIVDDHSVPGVTLGPDWAQVAARLGMTLVAGTGYQYGDTDFLEYSERLYLDFTRYLRTGSGPIPIGNALVQAKRRYLATIAEWRGIHEKALLQATLFGLPMLAVNFPSPPGTRVPPPADTSEIDAPAGFASDPPTPGEVLGLKFADLAVVADLTPHTLILNNAEFDPDNPDDAAQVTASWFSGTDGVAVLPAEPVLPLEIRNVTVPGLPLRGIGFRGGEYIDAPDVIPLTGAATTEIRGVHPAFLSEVFYPTKFWRANYFDALCQPDGDTRLFVTPAQFQSYPGRSDGVLRRYPRTDVRLFYSDNVQTYTSDDGTSSATPALSAPPQIAHIRADVEPGQVRFQITVVGNPAAGIQAVWVTYTSVTAPLYGTWTALDLIQRMDDSRIWEAVLPLGDNLPSNLRFVVSAVNGVGLVTFASNLGAYYVPGFIDAPPTPPTPTVVALVSPPSSGVYGNRVELRARLTRGGTPVAGRSLTFRLGALEARGLTDADGFASVRVNLLLAPGLHTLRAFFPGTATLAPSSVETAFTLGRSPTTMTLTPSLATVQPDAGNPFAATVLDDSSRALLEQTVVFLVEGPGGNYVATSITDFNGRAILGPVPLPPGSYTVRAWFGEVAPLPPPYPAVGSPHPLYLPSSADVAPGVPGTLNIDAGAPFALDDEVPGRPAEILKIPIALLLANDSDPGGGPVHFVTSDATTGRARSVTRSGPLLLVDTLPDDAATDSFYYTIADADGNTASARVVIRIAPPEGAAANLIDTLLLPDGRLHLRFLGIPGRTYRIQFSPGLSPPTWVSIGHATAGGDGIVEFITPAAVGPAGFYRTAYP